MIEEVLASRELRERPPVLVDIGAAGQLHADWKPLAPYSICIAFDADDRDFGEQVSCSSYRALYLHNHIVTDGHARELDFHLTRSPSCSSTLRPLTSRLGEWRFAELFDVERTVKLQARTLSSVLAEHDLGYVDCFKTDSQGTDLRLFLSLGDAVVERVLAADFEPGIIDAYEGEDKLHALLAKIDELPFWMHQMTVRGTQRLSRDLWERYVRRRVRKSAPMSLKESPGWAEVSFLNTLQPGSAFDKRDFLLMWVLATIHEQHGFALQTAERGRRRFGDARFDELARRSLHQTVRAGDGGLPEAARRAIGIVRRVGSRLFRAR